MESGRVAGGSDEVAAREKGPAGLTSSRGGSRLPVWVRVVYGAGWGGSTVMERLAFIWLYFWLL
jgi:hypothetical protein